MTDGVLPAIYTGVAGEVIGGLIESAYDLGPIASCHLIRRGMNDVYAVRSHSGRRYVARLSHVRARGPSNLAYEAAFLAHLTALGAPVAAVVADSQGGLWRNLPSAEGPRAFAVFEHAAGRPPESDSEDVFLLGSSLAAIHMGGDSFTGPESLRTLDGDYLLARPLAGLLAAPTIDQPLGQAYAALAAELASRLEAAWPALSQGICHGDCHVNAHVRTDERGRRVIAYFDFDDLGPGPLAYDLGTYLFHLGRRAEPGVYPAAALQAWARYIEGYRGGRTLSQPDFEAAALFAVVRWFIWFGENADRIPQWGMESLSRPWLRMQVKVVRRWLATPTPCV